jgi:hypothetical protein
MRNDDDVDTTRPLRPDHAVRPGSLPRLISRLYRRADAAARAGALTAL